MKKTTKYFKILLITALVGIFGLQLVVGASATRPIEGFSGTRSLESTYEIGQPGSPSDLHIHPGQEIRIPLTADMFDWSSGRTPLPMEAVTARELRRSRVQIKTTTRKGSEVLDYVQLNTDTFEGRPFTVQGENRGTGKTAYVSVVFADRLLSVDEVPFVIEIELTANRDVHDDFIMVLEGVMSNEEVNIRQDTDFVKINDDMVAVADYNVPNVTFDLGNGVSIDKNTFKNQKYYGFTAVVDSMDIIREAFPDVHEIVTAVYKMETINLQHTNAGVTIVPKLNPKYPDVTNFYVYDADLEFLGMTDEALPHSDLYVLAVEELPSLDQQEYLDTLEDAPNQQRA